MEILDRNVLYVAGPCVFYAANYFVEISKKLFILVDFSVPVDIYW
jgi:hypothetical protein